MDFDLSEEQRLLKESVDGLLTDAYEFEQRKKYMKEKGGWSRAIWGRLAEQGLLGLPFAEADGGFGAGAVEKHINNIFAKLGLPPADRDNRRVIAVLRYLETG